ncbi:hypothetical protein RRM65_003012 [Aeromonas salmonicida subsp. salmonicida]|nr:hypothetical protein [Aeromonas salmonicida subsp. salmonicida]
MKDFIFTKPMLVVFLLCCGMVSEFATASSESDLCAVAGDTSWMLSDPVTRTFSGPQHSAPLGVLGDLTNEVGRQLYRDCKAVDKDIIAVANGALEEVHNHSSGKEYVVYKLPDVPGIGVSIDVKDPNKSWIPLKNEPLTLITYGGPTLGIRSRLQFHIVGDIKPGVYNIPSMEIGSVWAQETTNPNNKLEPFKLYLPEITMVVNVYSCQLSVPERVELDSDLDKVTTFNVRIEECGGKTNVFSRFSDAEEPTVIKDRLKNTGSAKGYSLQIETRDGQSVDIIPIGTNATQGEIDMGQADINKPLSKEFQARVVKEGGGQEVGTLEFKAIVGVAYR